MILDKCWEEMSWEKIFDDERTMEIRLTATLVRPTKYLTF